MATRQGAPGENNDFVRRFILRPYSTWVEIHSSAPYPWSSIIGYLAGRAYTGLEAIDADAYRRALGNGASIEIRFAAGALDASLHGASEVPLDTIALLFDTNADVAAIDAHLARDRVLAPLVRARPGMRVPGAWHPFELAVRAILGQQVSVAAATTIAGRLVTKYGAVVRVPGPHRLRRLFPEPARIARARIETVGIVRARANAIRTLASVLTESPEIFARGRGLDRAVAELCRLPGIGEWTAQYVALRALREPDAFPASDLGLMRAYGQLVRRTVTPRELALAAEAWRPYRGYAAMHLWMN